MIICLIYDMSVLQEAMFNITLSLYSIIYYTIFDRIIITTFFLYKLINARISSN